MKTTLPRERVQHVLKYGERYARRGFVVCVLHQDCSSEVGKFSIVISKKVVKGAVLRNRLRRVLREVVKTFDYPGVDFVVLCRNRFDSESDARNRLHDLLREVFGA